MNCYRDSIFVDVRQNTAHSSIPPFHVGIRKTSLQIYRRTSIQSDKHNNSSICTILFFLYFFSCYCSCCCSVRSIHFFAQQNRAVVNRNQIEIFWNHLSISNGFIFAPNCWSREMNVKINLPAGIHRPLGANFECKFKGKFRRLIEMILNSFTIEMEIKIKYEWIDIIPRLVKRKWNLAPNWKQMIQRRSILFLQKS